MPFYPSGGHELAPADAVSKRGPPAPRTWNGRADPPLLAVLGASAAAVREQLRVLAAPWAPAGVTLVTDGRGPARALARGGVDLESDREAVHERLLGSLPPHAVTILAHTTRGGRPADLSDLVGEDCTRRPLIPPRWPACPPLDPGVGMGSCAGENRKWDGQGRPRSGLAVRLRGLLWTLSAAVGLAGLGERQERITIHAPRDARIR